MTYSIVRQAIGASDTHLRCACGSEARWCVKSKHGDAENFQYACDQHLTDAIIASQHSVRARGNSQDTTRMLFL